MSQPNSGRSTPTIRFTAQAESAEDLLRQQTVGLVHLSDFRKRRADAVEQSAQGDGDSAERELKAPIFKRKKRIVKGALSFDVENRDENDFDNTIHSNATTRSATPADVSQSHNDSDESVITMKKKLKPHAGVAFAPKSQSKSALIRETQLKEALRKQYVQTQEAVRNTDFMLPFVFFDGKDNIGGKVRMKKGDHIWLFLERARKVGAESAGTTNGLRKDWARISVDDLMIVRQDLILPAHLEFHYFILNRIKGYHGPLFSLSAESTSATPALSQPAIESSDATPEPAQAVPLDPDPSAMVKMADQDLEGFEEEPSLTRVVDRRWFERNKHIYPASVWEDFDAQRDYTKGSRKDRDGNHMFFSR